MSLSDAKKFLQKYSILLASASPRRKEIFSFLGVPFEIWATQVEEQASTDKDVFSQVNEIAIKKAEKAQVFYPKSLIITADTEVILNGRLFGKPKSHEEAKEMLIELSGRTHIVATAVAIALPDKPIYVFQERSLVSFGEISLADIEEYLKLNDYQDKAGGYAIQHAFGACHIKKIDGCFFNVMGFPLNRFCLELSKLA